jgi:hypothetical protein
MIELNQENINWNDFEEITNEVFHQKFKKKAQNGYFVKLENSENLYAICKKNDKIIGISSVEVIPRYWMIKEEETINVL